jgi:soluble lytic murein transglycosylase-like protein
VKPNENTVKTPPVTQNFNQQELMKLIIMTQHQMNSDFFRAFDDSEWDSAPEDDSMNWIGNMKTGTGYDIDLSLSKTQQSLPSPEGHFVPIELKGIIDEASKAYNVDPALIQAVIQAESNFDPNSTSATGAMGLMQLMPETANELGVTNAYDPVENIHGGTRYLRNLLDRYDGNIPLSLAAYNWGMGNVEKPSSQIPRETQNYIFRVNQFYQKAKA